MKQPRESSEPACVKMHHQQRKMSDGRKADCGLRITQTCQLCRVLGSENGSETNRNLPTTGEGHKYPGTKRTKVTIKSIPRQLTQLSKVSDKRPQGKIHNLQDCPKLSTTHCSAETFQGGTNNIDFHSFT